MRDEEDCVVMIVLMLFGFMVGCFVGSAWSDDTNKQIAIQNKVGKWVIDPTSGEKTFIFECEICKQQTTK